MARSRIGLVLLTTTLAASGTGCRLRNRASTDSGATAPSPESTSSGHARTKRAKPSPVAAADKDAGPGGGTFSCWDEVPSPTECTEYRNLPRVIASVIRRECKGDEGVLRETPCPRTGMVGVCKSAIDMDDRYFSYEAIYSGESAAELERRCKESEGGTFSRTWP